MLESFLRLLLEPLPSVLAIPIGILGTGLIMSLVGKAKTYFDSVLTWQKLSASTPWFVHGLIMTHTVVGFSAAIWFYFQTDLLSPSVPIDLTHPLGRDFIRQTDWYAIGMGAVLPAVLIYATLLDRQNSRIAQHIFSVEILLIATVVLAIAAVQPSLLTQNPTISPWTLLGFFWWYTVVALITGSLGMVTALAVFVRYKLLKSA